MNIFENRNFSFSTKNKDEEGEYTLSEAKELCTTLEDGWRVPTCEELEIIHRDSIHKGLSTLIRDLNLKIDKSCYLTDTYDEYDG